MNRIALPLIAAAACLAQEQDRRVRIAHLTGEHAVMELATIMRSIGDVRNLTVDADGRTITFRAGGDSLKFADWVFDQLDRPADAQRARTADLTLDDPKEGVARVFFPRAAETPQSLQELATTLRATVEIRRVFTFNPHGAIVIRGTAKQAEAAQWLIAKLRPERGAITPGETKLDLREGVVHVVPLARMITPVDSQELATVLRSVTDMRWVFTLPTSQALVIRGLPEQIGAAEWLIAKMESEAAGPAKRHTFTLAKDSLQQVYPELEVRLYGLPAGFTPQRLQEFAVKMRTETQVRRIFTHNGARMIAARGTGDQIAAADRMFAEATMAR